MFLGAIALCNTRGRLLHCVLCSHSCFNQGNAVGGGRAEGFFYASEPEYFLWLDVVLGFPSFVCTLMFPCPSPVLSLIPYPPNLPTYFKEGINYSRKDLEI